MLRGIRKKIEDISWEDAADPSRWVRFARGQVRLYFYMLRELLRNRCLQQASALTFTTLLSLVPLLAVAFSFFRAFAAMEEWEAKARDAVLRSVFSEALIEGEMGGALEDDPAADGLEDVAGLEADQVLARADEEARAGAAGRALRRYVAALNEGADGRPVRRGMMALRLSHVGDLAAALDGMTQEARRRYLRGAGLGAGGLAAMPEGGTQDAGNGSALVAPEELLRRAAEQMTLAGIADLQGGAEAEATALHAALGATCDAVVLAAWAGPGQQMDAAVRRHGTVRERLGNSLLESAGQTARKYLDAPEGAPDAEETRAAALAGLREAELLLDRPGEARRLLGQVYEKAGMKDEALRAYNMALRSDGASAARGISLRVVGYLRDFIDKAGRAEIGIIGTLLLIVTATALLNTVEQTVNHIWKVKKRRPFWAKFTSFCTLIWLGPALLGAGIYLRSTMTGFVDRSVAGMEALRPVVNALLVGGSYLLPFLTMWLILLLLYEFLPHTRVRFRNAAWGAGVAALLLQLARPLFMAYAVRAFRYQHIYGSLGAVPLFLLWIWLLWVIVLFGAEVAFTTQNMALLRYQDKLQRLSTLFVDRYLAARVMMYVAREFWETGEPVRAGRLAEILQITPEEASDTAERLVRLGLLTPVGADRDEFHPARDLSRLKLSEVLSITDRFRDESRSARPQDKPYEDKLEAAFRSAITAQDEALGGATFRDLLAAAEQDRNKYPVPRDARRQQ